MPEHGTPLELWNTKKEQNTEHQLNSGGTPEHLKTPWNTN